MKRLLFIRGYNFLNIFILIIFSYVFSFLNFYWLTIILIIFITAITFLFAKNFLIGSIDEKIRMIREGTVFPIKGYIRGSEENLKVLRLLQSVLFNHSFYKISRERLNFLSASKYFSLRFRNFSYFKNLKLTALFLRLFYLKKNFESQFLVNLLTLRSKPLRQQISALSIQRNLSRGGGVLIIKFCYINYLYFFLNRGINM